MLKEKSYNHNINKQPLVTVVCLCYNHERFLEEAILSVINQTYSEIEIIIIDDFSSDNSQYLIKKLAKEYPSIIFFLHTQNIGNCKSFNEGLALARGKYIIDFATDDVMLPIRIKEQVTYFETLSNEYGVIYSNSKFIDIKGNSLGVYSNKILPTGDVFLDVLSYHVYEPSTMMVDTCFFKEIGGYNEMLEYEDFDFILKSSFKRKVGYIDRVLTQRRKLSNSHSTKLVSKRYEKMSHSTFLVCKEVRNWIDTPKEKHAWKKRVKYESILAMRNGYYNIVLDYISLFRADNILLFERFVLIVSAWVRSILSFLNFKQ